MNNKEFGKLLRGAGKLLEEGKDVEIRQGELQTEWFDISSFKFFGRDFDSWEFREKPSSVMPAPDTEWWEWRSGDTHQVVGVKYASEEAATKRKPEGGRTLHHVTMKSEHVERKPREFWKIVNAHSSITKVLTEFDFNALCHESDLEQVHWREVLEDE